MKQHDEAWWRGISGEFPIPAGVVYLNNGSFGPCPRPVIDAAVDYFRTMESSPTRYMSEHFNRVRNTVKPKLGAFLDAAPEQMVFILNLTVGMNMIAQGLRNLGPGDVVLSTEEEYGAVNNTWDYLAGQRGFTVRRISIPMPPESPEQIAGLFTEAFTPEVKACYFSHVTTRTGLIMPVQAICAAARERGITTIVDGAHAPGMFPFSLRTLDPDYYTGNCHKWLCAPKGSAFLYVRAERALELEPYLVGWGWNREQETFLGNFENAGTMNYAAYLAVGEAIDFQEKIGRDAMAARMRELAAYTKDCFEAIPGFHSLTSRRHDLSGAMSAFTFSALKPSSAETLSRKIADAGITVPLTHQFQDRTDLGWLRVSTHVYNNRAQIDLLADCFQDLG